MPSKRKRTRKLRGKGIGPSKMFKATVGALAIGTASAHVTPQAKVTANQIIQGSCNIDRSLVNQYHPDHRLLANGEINPQATIENFNHVWRQGVGVKRSQCRRNQGSTQGRTAKHQKKGTGATRRAAKASAKRKAQDREEQQKAKERSRRQEKADAKTGQDTTQDNSDYAASTKALGVTGALVTAAAINRGLRRKKEAEEAEEMGYPVAQTTLQQFGHTFNPEDEELLQIARQNIDQRRAEARHYRPRTPPRRGGKRKTRKKRRKKRKKRKTRRKKRRK